MEIHFNEPKEKLCVVERLNQTMELPQPPQHACISIFYAILMKTKIQRWQTQLYQDKSHCSQTELDNWGYWYEPNQPISVYTSVQELHYRVGHTQELQGRTNWTDGQKILTISLVFTPGI